MGCSFRPHLSRRSHSETHCPPITAYVTATGTYSDGSVYVFFDRQISSCNESGRLDIPASHPALKNILAIAMTAFAAGKMVRVHPGSCNGTTPQFTLTGDSYFYLTSF
jgi:hypothetical protein